MPRLLRRRLTPASFPALLLKSAAGASVQPGRGVMSKLCCPGHVCRSFYIAALSGASEFVAEAPRYTLGTPWRSRSDATLVEVTSGAPLVRILWAGVLAKGIGILLHDRTTAFSSVALVLQRWRYLRWTNTDHPGPVAIARGLGFELVAQTNTCC